MKNLFLKNLYVITPFKGDTTNLLQTTMESLLMNRSKTFLEHIIIYDKSSKEIILRLMKNFEYNSKFYKVSFHEAHEKGIYSAINLGLKYTPLESFYLVLGAGDLFKEIKGSLNISINKIIILPYKLSSSKNNKILSNLRNFYTGMPYCHNAIIYINDGSQYSNNYKISSDYDHFLKYVRRHKLNRKIILNNYQDKILIDFESSIGISSKSIFLKYFENMIIIYRDSGNTKLFLYIWHNLKKVFNLFWKKY